MNTLPAILTVFATFLAIPAHGYGERPGFPCQQSSGPPGGNSFRMLGLGSSIIELIEPANEPDLFFAHVGEGHWKLFAKKPSMYEPLLLGIESNPKLEIAMTIQIGEGGSDLTLIDQGVERSYRCSVPHAKGKKAGATSSSK